MGIIESWMKNHHNAEINNAQLFAPGSESRLLTSVRDLEQFGDDKLVGTIEGQVLQNSGYVEYL